MIRLTEPRPTRLSVFSSRVESGWYVRLGGLEVDAAVSVPAGTRSGSAEDDHCSQFTCLGRRAVSRNSTIADRNDSILTPLPAGW